MGALAAAAFGWRHTIVVCAVFVALAVLVLLVGRIRGRGHRTPPADDGNPIINALLHLLNYWP